MFYIRQSIRLFFTNQGSKQTGARINGKDNGLARTLGLLGFLSLEIFFLIQTWLYPGMTTADDHFRRGLSCVR